MAHIYQTFLKYPVDLTSATALEEERESLSVYWIKNSQTNDCTHDPTALFFKSTSMIAVNRRHHYRVYFVEENDNNKAS